jgi:hypothetical protein
MVLRGSKVKRIFRNESLKSIQIRVSSVYLYILLYSYLSYEELAQLKVMGTLDDTVDQFYGGRMFNFLNQFLSMHKV